MTRLEKTLIASCVVTLLACAFVLFITYGFDGVLFFIGVFAVSFLAGYATGVWR